MIINIKDYTIQSFIRQNQNHSQRIIISNL